MERHWVALEKLETVSHGLYTVAALLRAVVWPSRVRPTKLVRQRPSVVRMSSARSSPVRWLNVVRRRSRAMARTCSGTSREVATR